MDFYEPWYISSTPLRSRIRKIFRWNYCPHSTDILTISLLHYLTQHGNSKIVAPVNTRSRCDVLSSSHSEKKQRLFSPPPEKPTNENKTSDEEPSTSQQTRINLNPYAISRPIAHSSLFKLIDYRDCLKNRKDNLGVFISYQGKLHDKDTLELYENKMLPIYKSIMPERTKVTKHYMRKETDISAKRLSS
ncbi:hypothetical protein M0804_013455 [Polistes exclamans]|nr:hypothetical protein M0804_013455 [Polistes exclamans]